MKEKKNVFKANLVLSLKKFKKLQNSKVDL